MKPYSSLLTVLLLCACGSTSTPPSPSNTDPEPPLTQADSIAAGLRLSLEDQRTFDSITKAKADSIKAVMEPIVASMVKSTDEMSGTTWYHPSKASRDVHKKAFYCYIGITDVKMPVLRLVVRYSADNWLFVNRVEVKAGSERFDLSIPESEWDRDNSYGGIWEWADVMVTKRLLSQLLRSLHPIAPSSASTVRSTTAI